MLGRRRINAVARYFFEHGKSRSERRGGSRKTEQHVEITQSIKDHIRKLHVRESHYGRNKSCKQYLAPELSVTQLWRLWKEGRNVDGLPVASRELYSKVLIIQYYVFKVSGFEKFNLEHHIIFFCMQIFHYNFNLSFGTPKTDICSRCELYKIKIAAGENEQENKVQLQLHRLRAKKFFQLLSEARDDRRVMAIAFDMEQNQPLPKTNVSEAYYSRQLWLYNLGIVIHSSKQTRGHVRLYTWLESESGKGSNEIASALRDVLKRVHKNVVKHKIRQLHLFADSCPGQNKNSAVIAMLLQYVNSPENPFREIKVIFPIRGHSYMPPDRVFGRIEHDLRKQSVIKTPEE